jgi:hypothetical protein
MVARKQNTSSGCNAQMRSVQIATFWKVLRSSVPAISHFSFHYARIDLQLLFGQTALLPLAILII